MNIFYNLLLLHKNPYHRCSTGLYIYGPPQIFKVKQRWSKSSRLLLLLLLLFSMIFTAASILCNCSGESVVLF